MAKKKEPTLAILQAVFGRPAILVNQLAVGGDNDFLGIGFYDDGGSGARADGKQERARAKSKNPRSSGTFHPFLS